MKISNRLTDVVVWQYTCWRLQISCSYCFYFTRTIVYCSKKVQVVSEISKQLWCFSSSLFCQASPFIYALLFRLILIVSWLNCFYTCSINSHWTFGSRSLPRSRERSASTQVLHYCLKTPYFVSRGLLCLYNKLNNIWLLVDMNFLFSCSTSHSFAALTRELSG